MSKILKIEDAKIIEEKGKKVTRFIFNDDKIVRVDTKTDEVITKNVSKAYLDLISLYAAHTDIEKKVEKKSSAQQELENKIEVIRSGKGAGLGVLLGLLLKFTLIGPIIAAFCSFSFLNDISDEEYLKNTDAKEINFRKGFYSAANLFGWIVALACCAQWKVDMISVLRGDPNKESENKHLCFKVWVWIAFAFNVLYFLGMLSSTGSRSSYYY